MTEPQKYQCPYCKTWYETPREMALCTIRCDEAREEMEKRKRELEFKEKKAQRSSELKQKYVELQNLCKSYAHDYGTDLPITFPLKIFF